MTARRYESPGVGTGTLASEVHIEIVYTLYYTRCFLGYVDTHPLTASLLVLVVRGKLPCNGIRRLHVECNRMMWLNRYPLLCTSILVMNSADQPGSLYVRCSFHYHLTPKSEDPYGKAYDTQITDVLCARV